MGRIGRKRSLQMQMGQVSHEDGETETSLSDWFLKESNCLHDGCCTKKEQHGKNRRAFVSLRPTTFLTLSRLGRLGELCSANADFDDILTLTALYSLDMVCNGGYGREGHDSRWL